ncbi:MAG: YncE family protein, partial [Bacteroidota bacterium]
EDGTEVKVIDIKEMKMAKAIAVKNDPLDITFTPDGTIALVAYDKGLSEFDLKKRKVTSAISIEDGSIAVAVTPDGSYALAINYDTKVLLKRVLVIDMREKKVIQTIPVGRLPVAITITPDGNLAFVANAGDPRGPDDTVSVLKFGLLS